jgi:para-aminobenzoate synthetase/4-amino-4-deoxychorismate lyase
MIAGLDVSDPVRVLVRDAARGRWLQFSNPREILAAFTLADVVRGLEQVEDAVNRRGLHAAGFISYEAAPAFDPVLTTKAGGGFPLLWFGLYDGPQEVDLPDPPPDNGPTEADWQPSVGFAEFERNVNRIKAMIRRGDTYQVNYTYRLNAPLAVEPWDFFLHLVTAQEAPYGAFVDTGEWAIACASPELFFRLDGNAITCRPMKGTAARGLTLAQDRMQAETLRASEKEQAENVMIVDMVRHDLGRVAEIGSVNVPRLFDVEQYPTVWQMTSTVEARTRATLGETFRALFPPASITGAPKVKTMEIIARLETAPRRIYTGTIGFVAPGRRAQFNVAIRTLLLNRKARQAEYGVGGGITWDSQPEAEWQECRIKAWILRAWTPAFSLLETMLWTPEGGYFLLERHLDRLAQSALYFRFAVDLPAVRLELESLAARLVQTRQKVRLLITKTGRITLEAETLPLAGPALQRVAVAFAPADSSNPFLYHKTTNRGFYESARAARPGCDDVVLFNERGEVTESTIANLAVEIEGQLRTPPVRCGLLPGILRGDLLERGTLIEQIITLEQLRRSPCVFLLNSVRGMHRVEVVGRLEDKANGSPSPHAPAKEHPAGAAGGSLLNAKAVSQ